MAEHCVNYHLKTNERYMNEQERVHPVSASDQQLIRQAFKEQYHRPMYDWALIQTDKKRAKLTTMLNALPPAKQRPMTARSLTLSERSADLLIRTSTGVIDFNRAIYGKGERQLDSRRNEPTSIQKQGIFCWGSEEVVPVKKRSVMFETRPTTGNFNEYIIKKLFNPSFASALLPLANEHAELLDEILKWTEKKTNEYPIDPIRGRGSLQPKAEGAITKARLSEDHVFGPGHRTVRRAEMAKECVARSYNRGLARTGMSSNYMDHFCDDSHEGWKTQVPKLTEKVIHLKNPTPWAVFPTDNTKMRSAATNPYWKRQALDNTTTARTNRGIFQAKTCL